MILLVGAFLTGYAIQHTLVLGLPLHIITVQLTLRLSPYNEVLLEIKLRKRHILIIAVQMLILICNQCLKIASFLYWLLALPFASLVVIVFCLLLIEAFVFDGR